MAEDRAAAARRDADLHDTMRVVDFDGKLNRRCMT